MRIFSSSYYHVHRKKLGQEMGGRGCHGVINNRSLSAACGQAHLSGMAISAG